MPASPTYFSFFRKSGDPVKFEFLSVDGVPVPAKQKVKTIQNPGADGVGHWYMGVKGTPYKMVTTVDRESRNRAVDQLLVYEECIEAPEDGTVHYLGRREFLTRVLDVEEITIQTLGASSGGLFAPSLGILIARWTLQTTNVPD